MAAYRRVYDSRHLHADCQEPYQLRNPTLGNRVWATFTFFTITPAAAVQIVSRTDKGGVRMVVYPRAGEPDPLSAAFDSAS